MSAIKRRKSIRTNVNNNEQGPSLDTVLGPDVIKAMTLAEERRLKADLKKGVDIIKSNILKDIMTRCPFLATNLNSIINHKSTSTSTSTSTLTPIVTPSTTPTTDIVRDIFDNPSEEDSEVVYTPSSHNKLQIKAQPRTRQPKIQSKKRSIEDAELKDAILNNQHKRARIVYDSKLKTMVEDLGSDDTDTDIDHTDDSYVLDSFVTDGSDGSDDSDDESMNDSDNMDLDAEVNDLNNDYINTKGMTKEEAVNLQSMIRDVREQCSENRVDLFMVVKANFNKEDTAWFYKNIKRIPHLDAIDRFKLEDTVEKRYKLLISLQKAGMYTTFTKGAERDVMQEIITSKHSDCVKNVLVNRMCGVSYESLDEYQKALNWMDTVLSIPTDTKSSNNDVDVGQSIRTLHQILSTNMHGMDSTIREILQAVCMILTDPDNKGYILTLVGPPGVGKTTISSMIAEAINMGFGQISCASINDQATLTGHGSTYIGSKPGILTQFLINNQQLDNVILIDEMDKVGDSKITPILLHILDKSQNSRFRDAFCPEIAIDYSKNLYIVAVNSLEGLDKALLDRLKIVYVNGYSIDDKTQICLKHIIPRLNAKTGIKLSIDDTVVKRCVEAVSPDPSGARDVERFFGDVYEKLLLAQTMGPSYFALPKTFDVNKLKTIDSKLIKQLTGISV